MAVEVHAVACHGKTCEEYTANESSNKLVELGIDFLGQRVLYIFLDQLSR